MIILFFQLPLTILQVKPLLNFSEIDDQNKKSMPIAITQDKKSRLLLFYSAIYPGINFVNPPSCFLRIQSIRLKGGTKVCLRSLRNQKGL